MPMFVRLSMPQLVYDNLEYIDRVRVDEDVAFIQYHTKLPLMGSGRYAFFRVGEAITIKHNLIWSVLKYSTIVRELPERSKASHKLGLDDKQMHRLLSDLNQYFLASERFLDPDYCLTQMALDTGYSRNQLSFALNQMLGLSFYQYINRHRIDWVINELKKKSGQSPAKISLCAGFNSLSVFYRCFRSRLGMTPREYVTTLENGCDGAVIPDSSVSDT
ncbi:helix-turn-helix domain-containing protein [Pseudomonas nitroreducens]|uniref:helix-turn-helix domain-containing protein n=1 Tax=Pseudomonas nitroreducens TaxID=46680 RepID=UPI0028AE5A60|nr:helix-turn-helix domain-containing protein [Pseudomonas nitroreducens]